MLTTRTDLHSKENTTLAPYGFRSALSKGRKFNQSHASYRTAFQRDRDRILHTTALRRLQHKTQVFINTEGDYYRTRLTHTLEVAQLGRSIARALGANEDLVEAICLAHDLGHPPFGHSGESVLNELMDKQGGFDHNKQSLRIVTELEERYPHYAGLNLTWEVREGIVKHETEYDFADGKHYNPGLRGHLEAQISNAADELAYTAHDLDDGLRSGLLTPDQLDAVALWQRLRTNIPWGKNNFDDLTRHRIIRRLIGLETKDLLANTNRSLDKINPLSPFDIQHLDANIVTWSPQFSLENRELRAFLRDNLYRHSRVTRMAKQAGTILRDLYTTYVNNPDRIPSTNMKLLKQYGPERTVCDYIAGMTDRFARDEHSQLRA